MIPLSSQTLQKTEDNFKVNAITGTDWNTNGTKSFEINNQQTYLNLSESFLLCKFTFTKAVMNTNAALVNDFSGKCLIVFVCTLEHKKLKRLIMSLLYLKWWNLHDIHLVKARRIYSWYDNGNKCRPQLKPKKRNVQQWCKNRK